MNVDEVAFLIVPVQSIYRKPKRAEHLAVIRAPIQAQGFRAIDEF